MAAEQAEENFRCRPGRSPHVVEPAARTEAVDVLGAVHAAVRPGADGSGQHLSFVELPVCAAVSGNRLVGQD